MHTKAESLAQAKAAYDREGYYRSPSVMHSLELELLRDRVGQISSQVRPEVVYERDGRTVRAIHGCHRYDDVCDRLVRLPRLVDLAAALLGEQPYVYQFKVNLKQPLTGAAWPWHQDFAFWREQDGMPTANAVTVTVLLDEVNERNGPLVIVPGSHRMGLFDMPESPGGGHDWHADVSADLSYTVSEDRAASLAEHYGTRVLTGPAGTIYAFHPSVVHSSADNTSPDRRAMLLITYNAVSNAPTRPTRPEFLVDRDTTAVSRLAEDRLAG